MTRRAFAVASLWLLACSPVGSGDAGDAPAAPVGSVHGTSASAGRSERAGRPEARAPRAAGGESAGIPDGAYQYVDETGRVRLALRLEDVPERQRSTARHISVTSPTATRRSAPAPVVEEPAATTRAPVVVYTTRSCPYCRAAIAYMDRIGQDYENKDVEADEDARDEYLSITGGSPGVPVIVVGRAWMQGWDRRHFDELVAQNQDD